MMEVIGECPKCKAPVYGPSPVGFESVKLVDPEGPKVSKVEGPVVVLGGSDCLTPEDLSNEPIDMKFILSFKERRNMAKDMEAYNSWSGTTPSGEWSTGE